MEKITRGLSAYQLKVIAIIAMAIDHIAWGFVPTASPLGLLMHLIGRMTMPIMCYFLVQGYQHTRNLKKYMGRLLLFAAISYFPFVYFSSGQLGFGSGNVLFTLFLGLCALWIKDHVKSPLARVLAIIGICFVSTLCDWPIFGVLLVLVFGSNQQNPKKQKIYFALVALSMSLLMSLPYLGVGLLQLMGKDPIVLWNLQRLPTLWEFCADAGMHLGVFLALPLLAKYNGDRGRGPGGRWLFYVFYPAHLILLSLIQWLVTR